MPQRLSSGVFCPVYQDLDAIGQMWSCRMPAITMSIQSLLHSRCTTSLSSSLTKPHLASVFALVSRKYATHRDPGSSSLLSQTLDQKQRAIPRRDSVGPFQLGLAQPVLGHGEKVQKWSELSPGGKGVYRPFIIAFSHVAELSGRLFLYSVAHY